MNSNGKWLARAGALLILIGFVLPSFTVSCTDMPGFSQEFTLAGIASPSNAFASGQPLLYLAPLGALAILVFALLPAGSRSLAVNYAIGQLVGGVASLLSILISLLSLSNQVNQVPGFDVTPAYGMFVLLIGYGLAGVGLAMQWGDSGKEASPGYFVHQDVSGAIPGSAPPDWIEERSSYAALPAPYLEVIRGNLPFQVVPLTKGDFAIGRSADNDLQLGVANVSRRHAKLRMAQGVWFIQDQDSSLGTIVNGKQVQASRLSPGDQITIGDVTFVFRQ